MNDLHVLGDVYNCQLKYNMIITSPENTFILSSTGTHLDQKSYDDVLTIDAKNKNIQYFPKGLELIFKNLKAIDLQSCRLKQLDEIFDYNPHLELMPFYRIKIFHIDSHMFDSLNELNYLILEKNRSTYES